MKEQVQEIIENSQIRYRIIDGECSECAWKEGSKETHGCQVINELVNQLVNQLDKSIGNI